MNTTWLIPFLSTLTLATGYVLLGARLGAAHTIGLAFTAGIGLSLFGTLILTAAGLSSISISILWLCLVLTALLKWKIKHPDEHFWTYPITALILLAPLWINLATLTPTSMFGLSVTAPFLEHLTPHTPLQATSFSGLAPLLALIPSLSALTQILPSLNPFGLYGTFNGICLILAAITLASGAGFHLRWSNLPLLTAGSLIFITLLNPAFHPSLLTTAQPNLFIALNILILALALLQPKPTTGPAVLPYALCLGTLALSQPSTWPFALAWLATYSIQTLRYNTQTLTLLGLALLFLVPISLVLAAATLWNLPLQLQTPWLPNHSPFSRITILILPLSLLGLAAYNILKNNPTLSPSLRLALATTALALIFNLSLVFAYGQDPRRGITLLQWLQFIFLLPWWELGFKWYNQSSFKDHMYKAPWVYGLALAALFIAAAQATPTWWKTTPTLPQQHAMHTGKQIAQSITQNPNTNSIRLAVIDPNPTLTSLIALNSGFPTLNAMPLWQNSQNNRHTLYSLLKENNINYLWLHHITPNIAATFQRPLNPQYSYLFRLTNNTYVLQHKFPHLNYQ